MAIDLARQPTQAEVTRFLRPITKTDTGCWLFQGESETPDGYAHHRPGPGQPRWLAHKYSYRIHNGHLTDGYQVDHLCHTQAVEAGTCDGGPSCPHRKCVNPAHLQEITASENTKRQNHANRNKDYCPQGHPLSGDNLIVWSDGKRRCRACRAKK